jgi:transcriptional regulator with XRE-family HTH domain
MENDFFTWITEETEKRGWGYSELGRKAGLSPATLSLVLSGQRKVSLSFCKGIAKAFGEPPEKILRLAGLLPPEPAPAKNEDQFLAVFRLLTAQQQNFLLDSARGLQGQPRPSNGSVTIIRDRSEPYAVPIQDNAAVPTDEEIMDALVLLDEAERIFVFDYIQWRLFEQAQRRNSSGKRRRTDEQKQAEWQQAIKHIDLLTAVDEAPAEWRQVIIQRLYDAAKKLEVENSPGDQAAGGKG